MVKNSGSRPRGRPRAYDPATALAQARDAFWQAGFSATSLDALGAATGMNRPSLYAAFGDKRALYLAALDRYWAEGRAALHRILGCDTPLPTALAELYAGAIALYLGGETPRGCFAINTAAVEAVADAEIRARLAALLAELDAGFTARFAAARECGELSPGADPAALGALAAATLHSLAIRARAGAPQPALEALAEAAVALLCRDLGTAGFSAAAPGG